MSTRLNANIKNSIIANAIVQAGIPVREGELVKRRAKWAEAVRVHAIGGHEEVAKVERLRKRVKKALESAPKKLVIEEDPIHRDYDIAVNIGGLQYRAYFSGKSEYHHEDNVYKITPPRCAILADHPLADEFHQIEAQAEAIEEERTTIAVNVRAALDNVRTVKRLLEEWPEAKDLLPSDIDEVKKKLPAIRREDLNIMIGLGR